MKKTVLSMMAVCMSVCMADALTGEEGAGYGQGFLASKDFGSMGYAALDGSGVWEKIETSPVRVDDGERESSNWVVVENDPTWFTNAVGERISVEGYCAIVAAEEAQDASLFALKKFKMCDSRLDRRLEMLFAGRGEDDVAEDDEKIVKYDTYSLGDDLYLMCESEGTGRMNMHSYEFVLYDGTTFRRLMPFESMPTSERIIASLREARTNPAAMNNLAAMVFNQVADHHSVSWEYVYRLLKTAADAGEPMACRNLAVLYSSSWAYGFENEDDRDGQRDIWLRRAAASAKAVNGGLKPRLEKRPLKEWPLVFGKD